MDTLSVTKWGDKMVMKKRKKTYEIRNCLTKKAIKVETIVTKID